MGIKASKEALQPMMQGYATTLKDLIRSVFATIWRGVFFFQATQEQQQALAKEQQEEKTLVAKKPKKQQRKLDVFVPVPQKCDLFVLLHEDLIWNILQWTRPNDYDQSIWLWLCQISATCRDFRRLVRLERKGVPSMMPTMFKLVGSSQYQTRNDTRVELMDTILNSDWMASRVTRVQASEPSAFQEDDGVQNMEVTNGFLELLTSNDGLPALKGIKIYGPVQLFTGESLRRISQVHPELTSLFLFDCIRFQMFKPATVTPRDVYSFAKSLPHLQRVGFGASGCLSFNHLYNFLLALNPNVEHLELGDFQLSGLIVRQKGSGMFLPFKSLQALTIYDDEVDARQVANIIRANPKLSHLGLFGTMIQGDVSNVVLETQVCLKELRGTDNHDLARIVDGQVDMFGKNMALTTLGIPRVHKGLHPVLTRWRETTTNSVTVEILASPSQGVKDKFPGVSFKKRSWCPIPDDDTW